MKIILFVLTLASLIFGNTVFAVAYHCQGTWLLPCLVQDTENNSAEVKNYRDSYRLAKAYSGNIAGLAQLNISGSAVPSVAGFKTIVNNINTATNHAIKKIIDLDVRQESHGYLNQEAINLTAINDWANQGKTRAQVLISEKKWLNYLSQQNLIRYVLSHAQFKAGDYNHGRTIVMQSVLSEKAVAEAAHMDYARLTVTDHMAPLDEDVDRFIAIVTSRSPDTWLYIHCRGGDGRTTMFMAMIDMLKNADKATFDDIIKRQASVEPFYDLSIIHRSHADLTKYYAERLKFLMKFYEYSQAVSQGYTGTWSAWKKT